MYIVQLYMFCNHKHFKPVSQSYQRTKIKCVIFYDLKMSLNYVDWALLTCKKRGLNKQLGNILLTSSDFGALPHFEMGQITSEMKHYEELELCKGMVCPLGVQGKWFGKAHNISPFQHYTSNTEQLSA